MRTREPKCRASGRKYRSSDLIRFGGLRSGGDQGWSASAGEERENLRESRINSKAVASAELVDFAVFDEMIGPADADDGN